MQADHTVAASPGNNCTCDSDGVASGATGSDIVGANAAHAAKLKLKIHAGASFSKVLSTAADATTLVLDAEITNLDVDDYVKVGREQLPLVFWDYSGENLHGVRKWVDIVRGEFCPVHCQGRWWRHERDDKES